MFVETLYFKVFFWYINIKLIKIQWEFKVEIQIKGNSIELGGAMLMLSWICLICILLLVGKMMCFFSMSALLELHSEKAAVKNKKTRKRRAPSAEKGYAATGTYGKIYETGHIKSKRSI
ncbi:hypothetical protein [Peptoclostridium litorale]|uniref:hypothetical protein n=1 Tax=Peptoclostridium litorale TaxID=1557 RepID=UPI001378107F|nr:hypothetical protein [Peptoclostridium litorale]